MANGGPPALPAPQPPLAVPPAPPVQLPLPPIQLVVPPIQPIPTQPIQPAHMVTFLRTNDWMDTHAFLEGVKVQHFCLTLVGEARLWYES